MNFGFFLSLSELEAREFLERYLQVESENIGTILLRCRAEGIRCNYTVDSVPGVFHWIHARLKKTKTKPDPEMPDWILDSDSYWKYLFEFDAPSNVLILRASYYLGASFVNEFKCLHWTIGNKDTIEANMPVVSGFKHCMQMATIMIAENLFRRVSAEPTKIHDIEIAVQEWRDSVSM